MKNHPIAPMANHEILRDAIAQAESRMVSVTFIKADGTERQLTFNPRHKGQVLGTGHPIKDPEKAINNFKIMDIKLGQWRSFDARRVYRVKFQGKVVDLQPEGVAR
jgi:hypothetical protein